MRNDEPVIVKLKRAGNCDDLPLPRKMTEHSAGFDVAAAVKETVTLAPGDIRLIPCGFHIAVPPGYEAQVRPRSGLSSRHGITLVNTPGTIDADYRGEVMVPLMNVGREPFHVTRVMRIEQMVIAAVPRVVFVETREIYVTEGGGGGFGHRGG